MQLKITVSHPENLSILQFILKREKMKILMVYPRYPNTFWSFKHILKFISKKAAFPPLGLLTVASMLPAHWEKRLVDINVKDLKEEDIMWADMVFISAMIIQKESALEIIKKCKFLGKTVAVGGPLFTTRYEQFTGVDHFILGEAEVTLPMFLDDIENGNPGHLYRSKKRPDITKTPIPSWELIDFKDYATMAVQYSRGCPFNCEFCDIIIMNGRIPRTKNPAQLISEIQSLYDTGWRKSIFIVDDNFIGNKKKVKEMLKQLIIWQKAHNYPVMFLTEASSNLSDDVELMGLMRQANFSKVFVGLETPNIDSLKECKKTQNVTRSLANSVKIIQQNGMQVMGGFIVGFDNDTEKIFDAQIKFIQQIGVVTAMVGILTALPQTNLWKRLKSEGRLLKDTSGESTDGDLNFVPRMNREKLLTGYKKILANIYSPKSYYKRIGTFLTNYRPTAIGKINKDDIKAFFMSTWRIGVISKSSFRYWHLLLKTFFTKRKAIPVVVELAIFGLHFHRVAQKIVHA